MNIRIWIQIRKLILYDPLTSNLSLIPNMETNTGSSPIALVVGLSANGLAISRALSRSGVEVHAVEESNDLPATKTKYAKVHIIDGIHSDQLISILLSFREQFSLNQDIVLFPTSDKMVRVIGNNWDSLEGGYKLSWSSCIDTVLQLLDKDSLHDFCEVQNVAYPKSHVILKSEEPSTSITNIGFPVIVKPVKPLSSFKALKVGDYKEFQELILKYQSDLPFVAQQYIGGSETQLYIHTMYVENGDVLAGFTTRKLKSYPESLGIGTVLESVENEEVARLSSKFVNKTGFTGPIAIEFKKREDGVYFLIEPNVGRTELSVDIVIQAGINLPLIEFNSALKHNEMPECSMITLTTWFDTERDYFSYINSCIKYKSLRPKNKKPVFLYLGHNDMLPLLASIKILAVRAIKKLVRGLFLYRQKL